MVENMTLFEIVKAETKFNPDGFISIDFYNILSNYDCRENENRLFHTPLKTMGPLGNFLIKYHQENGFVFKLIKDSVFGFKIDIEKEDNPELYNWLVNEIDGSSWMDIDVEKSRRLDASEDMWNISVLYM